MPLDTRPRIQALIFDCDGTLVDSEPLGVAALLQEAAAFGCRLDANAALAAFKGKQMAACVEMLAGYCQHALPPDFIDRVRTRTAALQSVWALAHVAVMAWGLLMLLHARQPVWLEMAGRSVWAKVRPWIAAPGGTLAAGCAWALMPCGLLYSAALLAALGGSAAHGALIMAAFASGSAAWLLAAPWLWRVARKHLNARRAQWGTRLAGLALVGMTSYALWLHWIYKPGLWCR